MAARENRSPTGYNLARQVTVPFLPWKPLASLVTHRPQPGRAIVRARVRACGRERQRRFDI
jgi:hypothetical protein